MIETKNNLKIKFINMIRNEFELLNTLRKAVRRYDPYAKFFFDANQEPLTDEEEKELESYRDNENCLDFTSVKSIKELNRLIDNVNRREAIKEKNNPTKKDLNSYVTSIINELLPVLGVKEAKVCVDTPAGKSTISVKKGEEPTIVFENPDDEKQDATLSYTVKRDNGSDFTLNTNVNLVEEDETDSAKDETPIDITLDEPVECETVKEENETPVLSSRKVKLYDCGSSHIPQYYHAVQYICENVLFPEDIVYGPDGLKDVDIPEIPDIAVILPNVWGKISSFDIDIFMQWMTENENLRVFMLDPETFELKEIQCVMDLFDYTMTPQQEEVIMRYE